MAAVTIVDTVLDAVTRLRSCRTALDAARAVPVVRGQLRAALARVKMLPPRNRRLPTVDDAAGWAWRTLHEVPLSADDRGHLEVMLSELILLVGAPRETTAGQRGG
jgi:hypothetical protein